MDKPSTHRCLLCGFKHLSLARFLSLGTSCDALRFAQRVAREMASPEWFDVDHLSLLVGALCQHEDSLPPGAAQHVRAARTAAVRAVIDSDLDGYVANVLPRVTTLQHAAKSTCSSGVVGDEASELAHAKLHLVGFGIFDGSPIVVVDDDRYFAYLYAVFDLMTEGE